MAREQRHDIGTLRPMKRLKDGRIRVDAFLTRSGVLEYVLPNGKIQREYRPESEVFNPRSLDTMRGAIVTDDHPDTGLVDAKTARDLQRGIVGDNVRRDGNHVAATLYVSDGELISKMESGKRDVSPGYTCDIDRTPGISPQNERYDVVQRNIEYNHSAIVDVGRAGTSRVRMDAAQQVPNKERTMAVRKDDKERDQALLSAASKIPALEAQLATAEARADAAEGRVEALEAEVTRLRVPDPNADRVTELAGEVEKQKKRADAAERGLATLTDRIKAGVQKRVELEKAALEVLGDTDSRGQKMRFDDVEDRDIMSMVVEKLHGAGIDESRSDDYARARFDAAVEGFRAGSAALDAIRQEADKPDVKTRTDMRSLRADHDKRLQEAWMKPLPSAAKKGA